MGPFLMGFGIAGALLAVTVVTWGLGVVMGVIIFLIGFILYTDPREVARRRMRRSERRRGGMIR